MSNSHKYLKLTQFFLIQVKEATPETVKELSADPVFINLCQESGESRMLTVSKL